MGSLIIFSSPSAGSEAAAQGFLTSLLRDTELSCGVSSSLAATDSVKDFEE